MISRVRRRQPYHLQIAMPDAYCSLEEAHKIGPAQSSPLPNGDARPGRSESSQGVHYFVPLPVALFCGVVAWMHLLPTREPLDLRSTIDDDYY